MQQDCNQSELEEPSIIYNGNVSIEYNTINFDFDIEYLKNTLTTGLLYQLIMHNQHDMAHNFLHNKNQGKYTEEIYSTVNKSIDLKLDNVLSRLYTTQKYKSIANKLQQCDKNHMALCLLSFLCYGNSDKTFISVSNLEDNLLRDMSVIYYGRTVSSEMMKVVSSSQLSRPCLDKVIDPYSMKDICSEVEM